MHTFLRASALAGALLAPLSLAAAQGSNDCANAQPIAGTGLFAFNNSSATQDGPPSALCSAFGSDQIDKDVWFAWTAPSSDFFNVETCGFTAVDTKIAAYAGVACPPGAPLACNDDTCNLQSRIGFDAVQGSTYLLRVGSFPGASGGSGQIEISTGAVGGCANPSSGPDVIVGALTGLSRYGIVGDKTGYSIGTDSCNVGDQGLLWVSNNNQHPVIGQNIYRLENGRFEQLGQSWLKHGFTALQQELCCDCIDSGTGSVLGVGCSDPYSSGLNGSQGGLGPRWEVNPFTGNFSYPYSTQGQTGNATYKRIQVPTDDLSPSLHPTARYFGEGQYVSPDDAAAGNHYNNASYREISVGSLTSTGWVLSFIGNTEREKPAIHAWQAVDPNVQLEEVFVPGDGLLLVASRATQNLDSTWHYEYAVFNLNSARGVGSFQVPLLGGVQLSNIGFRDVDSHSGDPHSNVDWPGQVGGGALTWATETHAQNPFANPIRWGTLYNFRFDADSPPVAGTATMGLYQPGSPNSVTVAVPVPSDPGNCLVASYCVSAPNSAGPGATMSHLGSTSIMANDFELRSSGAIPAQFGLFYYGPNQIQVAFGDGFRCVGAGGVGTFRLSPAQAVDGGGISTKQVDFTTSPAGSGPGMIQSGSTWNFQHWYRDPLGPGGTGFNFSDGLSATFCP